MKKILILSLLAMGAGLLLALQLARDPGYILIAYGSWTFETSLFAMLVLLVLVSALLRLLFLLLGLLLSPFARKKADPRSRPRAS